ncbi:MAG TPA: hypothetical protein VN904_03285 [Chthoniobacterales bacterium]|nr:hypothetical protein [Chthoniobacterales bacterium]
MKKLPHLIVALLLAAAPAAFAGAQLDAQPAPTPEDENSHDLFSTESIYTLRSDFRDDHGKLGRGDSLYDDFSYDHRFLITGKWYFRLGVEYERFDFGGTDNGLPDHLQAAYGHVALEYIVHDHAGAGIELNPGVYFQDTVTGDAFDIPWRVFVSFPLKKDEIFGVIGLGGALYQDPPVAPGGGIIWLFSDHLRLEGVFPKPALVYEPNDDWQFRLLANLFYESFRTDDVVTPEKKLQLHNAVVQYSEDRAGVQVKYAGIKPFRIIAGAGYTFLREFDFFRANRRAKLDPAPYFQLSLEAKF